MSVNVHEELKRIHRKMREERTLKQRSNANEAEMGRGPMGRRVAGIQQSSERRRG